MKYDWLPLAEDNYNRRWQASDAILIISVDIYNGIAHISMTIGRHLKELIRQYDQQEINMEAFLQGVGYNIRWKAPAHHVAN